MTIRAPAVAGYFYPGSRAELARHISQVVSKPPSKLKARAVVCPHAGYIYSGAVAAAVYSAVELPDTFIILCPNHTGYGSDFDVSPDEEWVTPLGAVPVDETLRDRLLELFPGARLDGRAHAREHSLEVQLPFLQYLKQDFSFVPLCIRQQAYGMLEELGEAIAKLIADSGREILIVASSDMTHYESAESARVKDNLAIEQMLKLDPRGLYDTVHAHDISMCGYLPATVAMVAAKRLGATEGQLLRYANSGDVTRDYSEVVGYAGLAMV